jgi:SAM-dependent methyltransferase
MAAEDTERRRLKTGRMEGGGLMEVKSQESLAFVGSMPESYDKYVRPFLFEDYAEDLAERVANERPAAVLELACGTGVVTARLAAKLPNSRLVATDLSGDMLRVAQRNVANDSRIEWSTVDAHAIPYEAGEFDAIVCQFGVMFFDDKVQAFREAYRVLRPGGVFHFSVWNRIEESPAALVTKDVLTRLFPDNPPTFFNVPHGYSEPHQIERDLTEAGFARVTVQRVDFQSGLSDPESRARGVVEGSPLAAALQERDASPEMVKRELAAAYEAALGSELRVPLSALVVRAEP